MTTLRILIIAGLQTLALIAMVAERAYTLNSGKVVTLEVVPVDPTDMFRGDFVILSYKISRLDLSKLGGDDSFDLYEPVYVMLAQANGTWSAVSTHKAPVAPAGGQVMLQGTVTFVSGTSDTAPAELQVTYGIESFFVPQGKGKPLEDERQAGKVTVDIAVRSDGQAAIKALKVEGKPVHEETLF